MPCAHSLQSTETTVSHHTEIMRRIISLLFFLLVLATSAQHLARIDYKHYTSWYSHAEHIPIVVEYTLQPMGLSCDIKTERAKKFTGDPAHRIPNLNRDYRKSGYDRGHNMSAADNCCDKQAMKECFYFSNMTPQPHSFNAGKWEELEEKERQEALQQHHVIVTCGSLGKAAVIGEDSVAVPKYMWKVIYLPDHHNYLCYLFPNTDHVNQALEHYAVKLQEIEEKAHVHFKDGVVTVNANSGL